jgi:hypothetical protein
MLNFAEAHYYRDGLMKVKNILYIIKITPLWDAFCAHCAMYGCACARETRTKVDVKNIYLNIAFKKFFQQGILCGYPLGIRKYNDGTAIHHIDLR